MKPYIYMKPCGTVRSVAKLCPQLISHLFFKERSMMIQIDWKKLNACVLAGTLAVTASVALVPITSAVAQVRTLPDFTDLV